MRLCRLVDVSLLSRPRGEPLDSYILRSQHIAAGAALANFWTRRKKLATSPAGFLRDLRRYHFAIFGAGDPTIAGRFRVAGEDVSFGGDGQHQLEGCRPEQIEAELCKLISSVPLNEFFFMADEVIAEHCAVFLEKFFLIHPFVDGNGRVGRVVLEAFLQGYAFELTFKFDSSYKGRRRYVKALQHAHKFAPGSEHPDHRPHRDPMVYLRKFLLSSLMRAPRDVEEEAPPGFDD